MHRNLEQSLRPDAKQLRHARRDEARQRAVARSTQGELLIRVMSDDPANINAYGHGGESTRALATLLKQDVPNAVFLYQRRVDVRSHEDPIDLVAVTPSGVWVIDIQPCAGGRVQVRGRRGWFHRQYGRLVIRGRDRTAYLDRLMHQSVAVEEALADIDRPAVPVRPAFCFFDAETAWRGTPDLGEAAMTTPKRLISLLRNSSRTMSDYDVSMTAHALGQRLPRQHIRD
jgi:hypothetical protein